MYNIKGKVISILKEKNPTDKMTISPFVVDTGSKYGNEVMLQAVNNKEEVQKLKVGDEVNVSFYINGNKGKKKEGWDEPPYWINLNVDSIEVLSGSAQQEKPEPQQAPENDLPFQ